MNSDYYSVDPSELSPADSHRLLLHCVAPRPIAFVSTISPDGVLNLAPFSYFMAGGANPPSVAFSPGIDRNSSPKDTLRNIVATREFVINVVTYAMRERMNQTSAEYPYGVSEWSEVGFEPIASDRVSPPRVSDSPLAMECRLFQIVPHGNGPTSANYVIGEVVRFHVSRSIMAPDSHAVDTEQVDYISRLGGDWYGRAIESSLFTMARPSRIALAELKMPE